MYHHRSQQGSQPFSSGPRPPHRHPPPSQHQNRPASDMSNVMDFQFPRPTQLPDELESALAIRGARDIDHRVIDHMNQSNQHQNQSSGSGIDQHGNYSSSPTPLTSDNQPGHQHGVDWSSYPPPSKLFANPPPGASHQPQRQQRPPQQPQSSHIGTSKQAWTGPVSDTLSHQAQHPRGGGGGDGQGLYTPESAGSILASFGLSNEDLEVLSHYPDEQLTPDTLPFILRDIQINKSGNQKTMASGPAASFSRTAHDMPVPHSRSPPLESLHSQEVPSLLTVTQTAGQVIDYGHASRSKDETRIRETFKREQLSSEKTIKIYPSPSSSSSAPKANKTERRHGHLEHAESSKHGDRDYRRMSHEHRKSNRSPGREFPPAPKSRNLDRDYRYDVAKPRPSPDVRSEASSRRSLSSSSGSKSHSGSSKKLPTPSMISDFLAAIPKVYPHTCSLCHIPCDHKEDWVDHINTVNHTAACRDLRNKYPDWKPRRSSPRSQKYGPPSLWHLTHHERSFSSSPPPSPPPSKDRVGPERHRPQGRSYSPYDHPRYQRSTEGSSRSAVKRPHDDSTKLSSDTSRRSSSKVACGAKHGPVQSSTKTVKGGMKLGSKTTKTASAKVADTSAKPPPAKKKKKIVTPTSQDSLGVNRLVYLTGIPNDASEQEVTDMVTSFGKINNVILMPCSEEEKTKGVGQKASVCMLTAGHAQALAKSTNLSIRGQQITASVAKAPRGKNMQKRESGQSSDANNSKPSPRQDKGATREDSAPHLSLPQAVTGVAEVKTSDEKDILLITGVPESGWSESDIIKLVQPFGTPCDIILAKQIGKVLVSVSDSETVQEIVKVNSFSPMKINDCELKMIHVKQNIGFTTPVALYNLLMASVDPLESSLPVGWSRLVVISNVPNTATGSSEVQKLVRRFGTVVKTLVLNSLVICEMATAAMALSVYKRFQRFPCIIHNNPLIFSRKPDPKPSIQTKVISAYLDLSEDTPANSKGSKRAAAEGKEQTAHKKIAKSSLEEMEKSSDVKDEEMKTEKTFGEDEAPGQNGRKDEDKKDGLSAMSDSSAAPDAQPEADLETDSRETVGNVTETTEEETDVSESTAGNDKTPAGEETEAPHSDDKAAPPETSMPEFPKVTQEMVKALLVECRTRTASQPNSTPASPPGEQKEMPMETDQGEKTVRETEKPAKKEEEIKNQDKEPKQARERERRAKKERERQDKARRERERRDEERRQWERRERERKREYGKGVSGPRSTHRSEGHKQSYWRDDTFKAKRKMVQEEEEELDDFPFNMSDFVTLDEVGDVSDLPRSPSPSVPMETTEEDAPASAQKDAPGGTTMEVTTDTITSEAATLLEKSDEHQSECEAAATSETAESSGLILNAAASPAPVSQPDSFPGQTPEPACQPEAPETEAFPAPASGACDDSSSSPARRLPTAENGEDEKEDKDSTPSQSKEEVVVSENLEECEKMQDEEDKDSSHTPSKEEVVVSENLEECEKMQDEEDEDSSHTPSKEEVVLSENLEESEKMQDEEDKDSTPSQSKEEVVVSENLEESEKMQDEEDKDSTPSQSKEEVVVSENLEDREKMQDEEDKDSTHTPSKKEVVVSENREEPEKMQDEEDKDSTPSQSKEEVVVSENREECEKMQDKDSTPSQSKEEVVVSENREQCEKMQDKDSTPSQSKQEAVVSEKLEDRKMMQDKETGAPAVRTEKPEISEDQPRTEEENVKKKMNTDYSLPPFDPSNPVGIEFLVPKIGFLCKPCNKFFTGSKEAEIIHCKTRKHYGCLQKYLQAGNMVNATAAANSSSLCD